jgi:DNA/RNA-binding domain of Phe-tRNA-synthetase-like protein
VTEEEGFQPVPGFVAPAVAGEFPGLRLDWLTVEVRDGHSPPALVGQLRELSNRYRGAVVVALRTKPIPSAYRTFFRQIGLDPDQTRIPSEEAAVQRLFHGAFRSEGRVADSLLVALVETGVAIFALDGDRVAPGGPGIRMALEGEHLGDGLRPRYLEAGTLVVADESTVHAVLFGEMDAPVRVRRGHHRLVLYAVAVAGVPEIHVTEAFWLALEGLRA